MRNYFAIAFTIVYLTLTVGVAKTTHYCMGREKNSSLFSFTTEKCVCSRLAKEPMSCCKDQHDLVQIDDDHSASSTITSPAPDFNFLGLVYSAIESKVLTNSNTIYTTEEINLPPAKVPIYQQLNSLVFYDSIA